MEPPERDGYEALPDEDPATFCDLSRAVPMRFVEGVGFVEGDEAGQLVLALRER